MTQTRDQVQYGRRSYDSTSEFAQSGGRTGTQDQRQRQQQQQSGSTSERHGSLLQTTWDDLEQEGAYVDVSTGDLFRVPQEAIVRGASPIIQRVSRMRSHLVRVSEDPYCPLLRAREIAANSNIEPNF